MTRRTAPSCPDCAGSPRAVPLVVGLPSAEAFDASDRGEVVLGGCLLTEGEPLPDRACPECRQPLR
ncbi:hypothetical protein [Geodermatophilus sp. SYSU D00684]